MKIKAHNMNPQLVSSQYMTKLGLSWQELFNPSIAIHANRELNMSKIKLVGFDMDYTLAIYKKLPMESLQYDLACDYLIEHLSYPTELKQTPFDQTLLIRGLVIDKQLGNVLKLDDQSYVWRAIHCRQKLTTEQIANLYGAKRIKVGQDRYYSLDTFFSIPEACLFIHAVECFYVLNDQGKLNNEYKNNQTGLLDFQRIFTEIRMAMDTIHSNGSLKTVISGNISEFIEQDGEIEATLRKLKREGKNLFLLTNSSFDYTNTVLSYVFNYKDQPHKSWLDLFDLVIVDAQKPLFFTESKPFVPHKSVENSKFKKVLSGGNIHDFHRTCDVRGAEVLYVGDHIYGDVLRSKKDSLWRTCLIIKELNFDIRKTIENRHDLKTLKQIQNDQSQADKRLMLLRTMLGMLQNRLLNQDHEMGPNTQALVDEIRSEIKKSTSTLQRLKTRHLRLNRQIEDKFHLLWGRLFKESQELSRFGAQVRQYACIYTDHIKNFLHYGANHMFFARKEQMSHEHDLE